MTTGRVIIRQLVIIAFVFLTETLLYADSRLNALAVTGYEKSPVELSARAVLWRLLENETGGIQIERIPNIEECDVFEYQAITTWDEAIPLGMHLYHQRYVPAGFILLLNNLTSLYEDNKKSRSCQTVVGPPKYTT